MSIEIHTFSLKKIHLKMSSGKWRPFCLGLNVLTHLTYALLLSHMDDLLTHPNAVGILLLSHMDDLLTHPNAVGILLLSHMDDLLTHPNAVGILLLSHMDDLLSHALDFSTVYMDIFAI